MAGTKGVAEGELTEFPQLLIWFRLQTPIQAAGENHPKDLQDRRRREERMRKQNGCSGGSSLQTVWPQTGVAN